MNNTMRKGIGGLVVLSTPAVALTLVFVFIPFAFAIGLSFLQLDTILDTPEFVGLQNFVTVLTGGEFWNAFKNGLVYSGFAVALQIVIGVTFALVLNEKFPGRGIARAAAIAPYVVPTVAGVQIFKFLLDDNTGLITDWTKAMGFQIPWLSTPGWAMVTVIGISVWLWTPFVTVVVLAGLQGVSSELHEAAKVDGAGPIRRFIHITLPEIAPVLAVVGLLRGIWMFNKFDVIYLSTGGGPLHATEHLPLLSYTLSFGSFELGRGAAVSALNFVFLAFVAVIYIRLTRLHAKD